MNKRALMRLREEWPTWTALAACYLVWAAAVVGHEALGWTWLVPAILTVTFHSSLQHEMLHGHPTRSAAINQALVFPAVGLFIPYRRFRDLHLRHHNNARLTDPYDDPESWYLTEAGWAHTSTPMRTLLKANGTLAGRLLLGPAFSLFQFWNSELHLFRAGDKRVRNAWFLHVAGVAPVLAILVVADVDLLTYLLAVAYPGMSLLMIRTFIEHRAAEPVLERTAIVETGGFMSLLFLNNNLHAVHHRYPALAWHRLPDRWRREREVVLAENAGYHFPGGYLQVARQWMFTRREPLIHPFLRREQQPVSVGIPEKESLGIY